MVLTKDSFRCSRSVFFFLFSMSCTVFFFSVLGSMNWLDSPHLLHGYIYVVDISKLWFFSRLFPPILLGHMKIANYFFFPEKVFLFLFPQSSHELPPPDVHHFRRSI